MISLLIPQELKVLCLNHLKDNSMGHRDKFNGSVEKQYAGLIAENMVRNYYGLPYEFGESFDGGFDFELKGKKVDVKTMIRSVDPKPHYANNFVAYQKDFECDILYFTSINKKTSTLWLCGVMYKKDFLDQASFFEKGDTRTRDDGTEFELEAPLYEITNKLLIPITREV